MTIRQILAENDPVPRAASRKLAFLLVLLAGLILLTLLNLFADIRGLFLGIPLIIFWISTLAASLCALAVYAYKKVFLVWSTEVDQAGEQS